MIILLTYMVGLLLLNRTLAFVLNNPMNMADVFNYHIRLNRKAVIDALRKSE